LNAKFYQFSLYVAAQLKYSSFVHRQLQEKHRMLQKHERIIIALAISIAVIILVAVVIWRVAFFIPTPQLQTDHYHHEHSSSEPITEGTTGYKSNLNDVIKAARTWQPAYTRWIGQKAPDFTLADINGKQHTLSDYRGRNVMIVLWATWCGPCKAEVPHLIALRNLIGQDKLAILAISYVSTAPRETAEVVEDFVKRNKINYTVFSTDASTMPTPFRYIRSIPCSFFIDKNGKIKLATEGLLSLGEIKAILQAE
jgi:peroxiredoxin